MTGVLFEFRAVLLRIKLFRKPIIENQQSPGNAARQVISRGFQYCDAAKCKLAGHIASAVRLCRSGVEARSGMTEVRWA